MIEAFRRDVLAGLAARPRAIPARWFYDEEGSRLFDAITELPEYYPTRVESAILTQHGDAIAKALRGRTLVEFGAGSATKTRALLAAGPRAYVPIDISADHLAATAQALAAAFPDIIIRPIAADFTAPLSLAEHAPVGFFPGSTIGNFSAHSAVDLLRHFRALLGDRAQLLIGLDRIKPVETLLAAYDDAAGVTARFNRNLLVRINRELGGDLPLDAFVHEARWNDALARIEMHLVARHAVAFTVSGEPFAMNEGETIHTENSHKYGRRDARLLLAAGGWRVTDEWTDEQEQFAVLLCTAGIERGAP